MRRKTVKRLIVSTVILLLLVFLGTLGLSYYVGSQLIHPARKPIKDTPADVALAYKNISFRSDTDSVLLRGWLIPADSSSGRIVIEAHGYKDNRSGIAASLPVAKALHNVHIATILFDFRASGNSDGNTVTVGQDETGDLVGAVDYARKTGYHKIGVIGYSMGASTALMAAAADDSIRAVIADSPFADLSAYLESHLPIWSHLPAWPFTNEILWEIRTFDGLNPANVDPEQKLRHWQPRPLMLIAGTKDSKIPYQNSESLYQVVRSNPADTLWLVPGADHVKSYDTEPKIYLHKVSSFFLRHLK